MIRVMLGMIFLINTVVFSAPRIEKVRESKIPVIVEFQGRAKSADMVKVYSDIEGNIEGIFVENGDNVDKGDIIAVIENRQIEIELEEARGNYEIAKALYEKYDILYSEDLVSEKEMYVYKGEYIQKKGLYDQVIKSYEDLRIRAISKGVVGDIELVIGDKIVAGQEIGTIASDKEVEIVGYVDSKDINNISGGDNANIDFVEGLSYAGSISKINPFIDKEIKKFKVEVKFEKDSKTILDDLYGDVSINIRDEVKLTLPKESILYYNLKTYIYKIEDNRYKKTLVELGEEYKGVFEVVEGVVKGEKIVVSDLYNIVDGEMVR